MTSSIQFDFTALAKVDPMLERLATDINKTGKQALNATTRILKAELKRGLAGELNMPMAVIRRRVPLKNRGSATEKKIWLGLNPVAVSRLNPKQHRKGVKARRYVFEGAFIAPTKGGLQVFRRVGRKRLPILKQFVAIEDQSVPRAKEVIKKAGFIFNQEFEKRL
ncbi:hypothetical protein [Piscirickettsia litoralis]|uniref:Phage tail protein n=1 Tax=Piscirickettsia litoralis TaxID=1891921 RepID=A0ABX2ZYU5_9GAMM|nr:hypothetical protein [Piscirickettsia litoralis]ODN41559.1 hypothetical protein BGC07_15740 [Piscirickettsia litoralis]